jgi:WD40 repeat protein
MGNIYTHDKNKINLLMEISSRDLTKIADKFLLYPDQSLSLEEFVDTLADALKDTNLPKRDDFIE